jgi:hypothetical protein
MAVFFLGLFLVFGLLRLPLYPCGGSQLLAFCRWDRSVTVRGESPLSEDSNEKNQGKRSVDANAKIYGS